MTPLCEALDSYLALRRGLGAELRAPGATLRRFVEFLDTQGAAFITTELALRWATTSAPSDIMPAGWARRLDEVRRFAAWLSTIDPRTEVPPRGLLPHRYRRHPPYIYSDQEMERIVEAATRLHSPAGLRAHSYATLFGLLAATGLRLGEALALDRDDVDLHGDVLAIRRAKFGRSRFVPIHATTSEALKHYAKQRDHICNENAEYNFAVVSRSIGLRPATTAYRRGYGPRLHDMRHRLAVKVLIRWYRDGRDVERELPKLSAYLGHVYVADTYWYIEAVPELLQLATERATRPREGAP